MATFPTIHLNGTSIEALLEQNRQVSRALRATLEAMSEAAPHGRDYYPQGSEALGQALAEHKSRVDQILSLLEEYRVQHIHLLNEQTKRERK
jgi:pantothenate synthetase